MSNLKRCIMLVSLVILLPGFVCAADTWIIYYTRSGNNKMIAGHIQSQLPGAYLVEIKTKDDGSGILGFISSMLDQWLDRDADIEVGEMQVGEDDVVVMCAPIWLQTPLLPRPDCRLTFRKFNLKITLFREECRLVFALDW